MTAQFLPYLLKGVLIKVPWYIGVLLYIRLSNEINELNTSL